MSKERVRAKLAEILSPQKLAREQFDTYQEYCLEVLDKAKECIIELADPSKLEALTFESPAGDCMGRDNNVLNFGIFRQMDISEALELLLYLDRVACGTDDPNRFDITNF